MAVIFMVEVGEYLKDSFAMRIRENGRLGITSASSHETEPATDVYESKADMSTSWALNLRMP